MLFGAFSISAQDVALAIPWGVTYVRAPEVWATGNTGQDVVVGILDSGVNQSSELNVIGGKNVATMDSTDWSDNISVCNGHGTHVAGTVGSTSYGVAPGTKIFAYKIFQVINGGCASWSSSQITAIRDAQARGIRVLNASVGGSPGGAIFITVGDYGRQGGALVASAGNNVPSILSPAVYPEATAVGAVNSSGNKSSYSATGWPLDIMAPGDGIVSLSRTAGNTVTKSGTSMASPHVAGVFALLLKRQPTLTTRDLQHVVEITARDRGASGRDQLYGYGIIDAFAADSFLIANPNFHAPPPVFTPSVINVSKASGRISDSISVETISDAWSVSNLTVSEQFGAGFSFIYGRDYLVIRYLWGSVTYPLPKTWTIEF